MSVHTTADGRHFVKYRVKDPETGKRKIKKEYFGRGKEAEAKACERDAELKAQGKIGEYTIGIRKPSMPLFNQVAHEYLQAKTNELSEVSIDNIYYKLTAAILPEIGGLEVNQITAYRLDQYVKKRLKIVKKTTVHRELSDIMAILNWGVNRDMIPRNPVLGYKKPKRDDAITRPPDMDEIRAILQHASEHCRRALLINYYTGLRPGNSELYKLTWHDVSWTDKTILVRSARKGGPVKRSVAIHSALFEYLKQWYEADGKNKHPYIIYFRKQWPIKSLKTAFKAAKRRAGITRKLRPYDFRHAAITQMILHGDLKAASEIAGHSDVQMTIRQYEHITSKVKQKTVEGIERVEWE